MKSEACPVCLKSDFDATSVTWIGCDQCYTWSHWACVSNKSTPIDKINKWYCLQCLTDARTAGKALEITFKHTLRDTLRARKSVDYANLDHTVPTDPERWIRLIKTKNITDNHFKRMDPSHFTDHWLFSEHSFLEPVYFDSLDGLGAKMPPSDIPIQTIAKLVGPSRPIEVIDVASQSSLSHWTVQQWADYYDLTPRKQIRNVISLEFSDTPLSTLVDAPQIVRKLDWVENAWPKSISHSPDFPKVQKYCLMSVEKCWTDWHIDFAGSSVYYHILRGLKVFYFIRPTPENLAAYEEWSGSAKQQENVWLGDKVDKVYRITLQAGNTMIIPTGWIHAVHTPQDSLVIGGNFLHSLNIDIQLKVYQIELNTRVPKKFRFPSFIKLLWHVAARYLSLIQQYPSSPELPPRILHGLKSLSIFLSNQNARLDQKNSHIASADKRHIATHTNHTNTNTHTHAHAHENVPWDFVLTPQALILEFQKHLGLLLNENPQTWPLSLVLPNTTTNTTTTTVSTVKKRKPIDAGTANHPKSKPKTSQSPNSRNPNDNIISRETTTNPPLSIQEPRSDPKAPHLGDRLANITSQSSLTKVVRRSIDENGATVLETRSLTTTIEKVVWLPSSFPQTAADPDPSLPIDTIPQTATVPIVTIPQTAANIYLPSQSPKTSDQTYIFKTIDQ